MRIATTGAALLALGVMTAELSAQRARPEECQPGPSTTTGQGGPPARAQEYDVVVSVPNLCVQRIQLDVDNLEAHLALNARVANLIRVQAGADVSIAEVSLGIRGVRAEVLLLVDLDNLVAVVDRTLTFIDNNPQVVSQLVGTVQHTVGVAGGVANTALRPGGVVDRTVGVVGQTLDNVTAPGGLLTQTVNTLGHTVQLTLDQTGGLVERTLSTTGQVLGSRTLGSVTSLPLVREATNAAGEAVRTVRHTSGALIEYTLGQAGRVTGARIVQPAAAPRQ